MRVFVHACMCIPAVYARACVYACMSVRVYGVNVYDCVWVGAPLCQLPLRTGKFSIAGDFSVAGEIGISFASDCSQAAG